MIDCKVFAKSMAEALAEALAASRVERGLVKVEAWDSDALVVTGCGGGVEIVRTVKAGVDRQGQIVFDPSKLIEALRVIDAETVDLTYDNHKLIYTAGKSRGSVPAEEGEAYPEVAFDDAPDSPYHLPAADLLRALETAEKAIDSASSGRVALEGVYIHPYADCILCVGANGYRVHYGRVEAEAEGDLPEPVVIPQKAAQLLLSMLRKAKDRKVYFSITPRAIMVILDTPGRNSFAAVNINAKYPGSALEMYNLSPDTVVTADAAALADAIKFADVFGRDAGNTIHLTHNLETKITTVRGVSQEKGEATAQIHTTASGREFSLIKASLNKTYLREALDAMGSPEAALGYTPNEAGKIASAVILTGALEGYKAIVMPMTVRDDDEPTPAAVPNSDDDPEDGEINPAYLADYLTGQSEE